MGTAAALAHALLREGRELVEVVVAGGDLVPAGRDADLRLAEVVLAEADRAEHRARGRAAGALGDLPAPGPSPVHDRCPSSSPVHLRVEALTVPTRRATARTRTVPLPGPMTRPRHPDPARRRPKLVAARRARRGDLRGEARPTPPLEGDTSADVVILGGGYTGMWTAYHLKRMDPGVDVVILEQDICGGGPSGRNGGFCNSYWSSLDELAEAVRRSRRPGAVRGGRAQRRCDRRRSATNTASTPGTARTAISPRPPPRPRWARGPTSS